MLFLLSNHKTVTYCPAQLNQDNCIKSITFKKKKGGLVHEKNQHIKIV